MKIPAVAKRILFEDNHLLIFNKMPSEIVQGDQTGDPPLSEILKEYIKERDHKPGNVFLGVVHRLDRPVSGAVVFAKTSKALARMNEMLKSGDIRKTYWAVVKNRPAEDEGHLENWIRKNEEKNKSFIYKGEVHGARKAELKYRVIGRSDQYYLLEVILMTGRHHQIRSQLSAIGCPVKGDLKYGYDRSNPDGSIHLHSRKIEFIHPVRKETIIVRANPPGDVLWDHFVKEHPAD
jgi:23S rRNA pseudouridine1911/1915/1917 synthase